MLTHHLPLTPACQGEHGWKPWQITLNNAAWTPDTRMQSKARSMSPTSNSITLRKVISDYILSSQEIRWVSTPTVHRPNRWNSKPPNTGLWKSSWPKFRTLQFLMRTLTFVGLWGSCECEHWLMCVINAFCYDCQILGLGSSTKSWGFLYLAGALGYSRTDTDLVPTWWFISVSHSQFYHSHDHGILRKSYQG